MLILLNVVLIKLQTTFRSGDFNGKSHRKGSFYRKIVKKVVAVVGGLAGSVGPISTFDYFTKRETV